MVSLLRQRSGVYDLVDVGHCAESRTRRLDFVLPVGELHTLFLPQPVPELLLVALS